jgi:hypothetical protein
MSPYRQDFTALVGQAGEQVNGIYEADYRDFNRDTYIRGRETFDETYAAFKRLLVGAWRRDDLARGASAAPPRETADAVPTPTPTPPPRRAGVAVRAADVSRAKRGGGGT